MLTDKVKKLEKLRDKLEKEQKKELAEAGRFYDGQLDVISKIQVEADQQDKVTEQKASIEKQRELELSDIRVKKEAKILSVYAQINLLTELISEGYELTKK